MGDGLKPLGDRTPRDLLPGESPFDPPPGRETGYVGLIFAKHFFSAAFALCLLVMVAGLGGYLFGNWKETGILFVASATPTAALMFGMAHLCEAIRDIAIRINRRPPQA
jgi:hypothetical protein